MTSGTIKIALFNLILLGAVLATGCADRESLSSAPDTFRFSALPHGVEGQALLLAIDDHLLPIQRNLSLYYSKPQVRREPVLTPSRDDPSKPDYIATHFYGTVLFDEGRYRMWYYAVGKEETERRLTIGPVCYAESKDGIEWRKPSLKQVEYKGSLDNNALKLPGKRMYGGHLIKDDKDPDPQQRYKMVYNLHNGTTWVFRIATSPDGIDWTVKEEDSVDQFIELSSLLRHGGMYFVHGQTIAYSEGGHPQGRQGSAYVSANFRDWVKGYAPAFWIREPTNPEDRGVRKPYDQVHMGVGAASFGTVAVGVYGLWHNFPGDPTRDTPAAWFGHAKTSADFGLLISNDGLHFREPVKGHAYLHRDDSPVTNEPGKNYPTILCQSGNGILNVGDETRIYHGRWRNAEYGEEYYAEIALTTLPRDRWGSLGLNPEGNKRLGPAEQGWVWSDAVTLPAEGCLVVLNADHARLMRVEVSGADFNLLPRYSGANSGVSKQESGLDCEVWAGPLGSSPSWAGRRSAFVCTCAEKERRPTPGSMRSISGARPRSRVSFGCEPLRPASTSCLFPSAYRNIAAVITWRKR